MAIKAFKKPVQLLSRYLWANPSTLFALQRAWLRFGYLYLDIRMASQVIRRPEWLRRDGKANHVDFAPPVDREHASHVPIAERLISSFRRANPDQSSQSGLIPDESMWGTLLQIQYQDIRHLVQRGEVQTLADYLKTLFRSKTVNGYTYGTTFDQAPHRWRFLPVGIELSIVILAESVGILRAECPEQGTITYWREQFTEDQLVERLEAFFGIRLETPRAGDPRGIIFGGRFFSRETCSHLYSAHRMRELINRQPDLPSVIDIVEIGGGYGGLAYWLRRLMGDRLGRYVIVDLPEVSIVQAFFLASVDQESLALYGEPCLGRAVNQLMPHWKLEEIDFRPAVLINQDSMPEMPESEVRRYLDWGARNVDGLFISFNQEAYEPWAGVPQVHVPTVVAQFPRYKRLARETSWDRRGYVEELYALTE